MRPRAQKCLVDPHPEEPRSGVSKDEATVSAPPFETQASPAPQGEDRNRTTALFDNLSEKLGGILDRLTRRGSLTEADVDTALREVRRALLEADVALDVARAFVERVKKEAVGIEVMKSVTPGQMVVKIVHDQLVATLGAGSQ